MSTKGKSDKPITVRATDDFRVYRVVVSIYSATGVLVEEGNAQREGTVRIGFISPHRTNPVTKG